MHHGDASPADHYVSMLMGTPRLSEYSSRVFPWLMCTLLQPDNDVGGEGTQAIVGSQAAKGPKSPVSKTAVLAPVAGEIPVMMPEKLPVTKVRMHEAPHYAQVLTQG